MAVEFRILGDVEARSQGRRLDIGHSRQRCVLVCLLLDVNRPVPADQLIDRVWAGQPPHRPRNALAAYISRLRQLLADDDDVQIVYGPGGYSLSADAQSVDLHLFRDLVSQARAAADPAASAAHFDRALELWRGEPLAALDTPWANDLRTSLEVERLSALLDRNDVALKTGRHNDVLGELATLAQAHPLDERIAGQLMLALYHSGRQADALETYRRVRNRLVDELGVDPGPTLRAMHQQILEGDLGSPAPLLAAPRTSVAAADLPRRPTSFVGRDHEMAQVAEALSEGPLVTLTGVGGVGKTRLALEVAESSQGRFADGVWLCEFTPLNDGAAVGQAVAATLRLQQRAGLGIEQTVIEYLRTRQLLLVVDNCEHVLDAAAGLIDDIVRHCPQVTVLATSREALGVEGEQNLPVGPLEAEDATALFADRAKASRPDFDAEREPVGAVAEICRRLDGVPLAIELAAARMRAMSSLDVARRLDRLRLLSGGARGAHPRQHSVTATIDWSYRLLAEPEQSLFERLSVFAGGFDLEAAHGVCADEDAGEDDTLELLTGLVDKSMVTVRSGTGVTRYHVLETLRAYGRDRLREKKIEDQIAERHARYYVELMERAAVGIRGPDEQAWVERITPNARAMFTAPDDGNVRTAFERAITVGDIGLALRLVTSMDEMIGLRIGYQSFRWVEPVVELADPADPLYVAAVGGAARAAVAHAELSHARKLARLAEGRAAGPGTSYLAYPADVLADVALYEGEVSVTLAHYEREVALARRDGDPLRLLWILYNITICHEARGMPAAGLPAAQEAMQVAEATANPTAQSMALCSLGRALKESDPDRALKLFEQAAELAEPVQNNFLAGVGWMEAAAIRAVHDDPASTARKFIELLDIWEPADTGTGYMMWLTMRHVTRVLIRLGAEDDALALHHALAGAGIPSLLPEDELACLGEHRGNILTFAAAVTLARSALQRYC